MKKTNVISLVTLYILSSIALSAIAADDAGRVMFVAGKATIVDATGQERVARKGVVLKQGDRLITSDKGMIQVKMRDEGVMAVRPSTDLKLDNLQPQANKKDVPSQALLLTKGGVRVLTGNANNKQGYLIKTAATSLKLREGDTETFVIPPLTPAAGNIKTDATPAGTYNRVNSGSGTFQVATGNALTLAPNQTSYSTSANPTPVLVASLPTSYISTTIPLQISSTNTTTLTATAPPPTLIAPSTLTIIAPTTSLATTSTTLSPTTSLTTTSTTLAPTTNLTTTSTTLATTSSPTITTAPLTTTMVAAPVYTTPVYVAPVSTAPVYVAPVYTAPVYTAPVYTAPVYTTPKLIKCPSGTIC